MKIITYNVNGLRSAIRKGLVEWIKSTNADIVCLQEIKCLPEQINMEDFEDLGFTSFWHSADKKGYSGVAIFSKIQPKGYCIGCGMKKYDLEGRVIRLDFENYSLLNVYMPSGSSGEIRQAFKMVWLDDFYKYISDLKKEYPNLIICGDFNICHEAIDIHNPKSNVKSSGFLLEERTWLSRFLELGFIDCFRHFNKEPHHYTWWSQRVNARDRNLGWRIDYQTVSKSMELRLKRAVILPDAQHSDHCPVLLEIL